MIARPRLDLSTFGTSVSPDAANMLAALIVQQFNQAWQARQADKSRPFVLVMDEFGDYTSGDVARMITGARKVGLWPVFSHQNLEQLVLKDDDRELLRAVLAIPNRVTFGGLFYDEAAILARQMYLAKIDPEEIKHVVETIAWKPVPTKVVLEAWSSSGGTTAGTSESAADGGSVGTTAVAGRSEVGGTETVGSNWQRSSAASFTTSHSWSHSTHEAWVTFYEEMKQKGSVTFRTIDEQVFNFAKQLVLQPRGQGAVARLREAPQLCRLPELKDLEQSEEDIAAFLQAVYSGKSGPLHLDTAEVDKHLAEHEHKLLAEAAPRAVGGFKPARTSKARKPRTGSDEGS